MSFPSLEKALEKISNRYLLVVLSARRARHINRGSPQQVESSKKKCTSVALEEVAQAKVGYRLKEDGQSSARL